MRAQVGCSDLVHWENLEGTGGEGGGRGFGMRNTCKLMAVSFQCMTKFTTNKKEKKIKIKITANSIKKN